jgi:hypothetical protein
LKEKKIPIERRNPSAIEKVSLREKAIVSSRKYPLERVE